MRPNDMSGKVALVTGASAFLGRATALRLADAGASVCLVDASGDALLQAADAVRARSAHVHVHATDLRVRTACVAAINDAVTKWGRLDALCNVATVFSPARTVNAKAEDWERSLAINLSAPFYLMQAALPHLLSTRGSVVNVLSPVTVLAHPYTAAYTASKAGLAQMTKAVAAEYVGSNVRINAVSFGGAGMGPGSTASIPEDLDPGLFQKFSAVRPPIDIDQVAEVIAFLASDAAQGFHGSVVTIDNGISLG